ncbi:MAG: GAF domain-containing protein [Anaerolineales bacterium]|nr:GAF domain-containing protein [Anaerolineales bacterium]
MLPDFRVRQRDYLLEISRSITEELDLRTVLARLLRASAELLASHAGLIALREENGDWRISASYGINPAFLSHLEPLFKEIPESEDPGRFEIMEVNTRLQRIIQSASHGLLTSVGLPLLIEQKVVGTIFMFRSYRSRFSAEDTSFLESFASQAAIAVMNARLFTQATQQKKFLDAVLDSTADGLFLLNPELQFSRFNLACSRLTGHMEEDVLYQNHAAIIQWKRREPGSSLEEAISTGWPAKNSPSSIYVEGDLIRKDKSLISIGITYAPIFSADESLLSIVANIRDITKFREAEELKSSFISVISHELRTPVALIKGYVGTLRREDAHWDRKTVQDSLAVIEEESDRLAELIDDLLDASRLQSGAPVLNLSEVNLGRLTTRLIERFKTQSGKHTFQSTVTENFAVIIADEERITQVITNLLSNAVKYSPDGGEITLSGRSTSDEYILCVSDHGPGVDPDDIPYIFDRFYRARTAVKKTSGAGLGLYLAKAVIEAHGGHIWVDESYQDGARICFSLPCNSE